MREEELEMHFRGLDELVISYSSSTAKMNDQDSMPTRRPERSKRVQREELETSLRHIKNKVPHAFARLEAMLRE